MGEWGGVGLGNSSTFIAADRRFLTFGAARMGYAGLHGNVAYVGGKPVIGTRLSLWGDATSGDKVGVDGLVAQLKTLPKDPTDPTKEEMQRLRDKKFNMNAFILLVDGILISYFFVSVLGWLSYSISHSTHLTN